MSAPNTEVPVDSRSDKPAAPNYWRVGVLVACMALYAVGFVLVVLEGHLTPAHVGLALLFTLGSLLALRYALRRERPR